MTKVEPVEERAEAEGEEMEHDSTSSKLDLILAQSLQMQSIFMAYMVLLVDSCHHRFNHRTLISNPEAKLQMKDQNSIRGGAGERWREGGGTADIANTDPSVTFKLCDVDHDGDATTMMLLLLMIMVIILMLMLTMVKKKKKKKKMMMMMMLIRW